MASRFLHPIVLCVVELCLSAATGGFTAKNSLLRPLALLACAAISWRGLSTFGDYVHTTGWAGRVLAGTLFSCPAVLFDRLIIRQWAYGEDYLGPAEDSEDERKKMSRWEWGLAVAGSQRCPGTEKEVANVPHFSDEDPQYLPPLNSFIIRQIIQVFVLYHVNNVALDIMLRADPELLTDAHIPFFGRLSSVSVKEVGTRIQIMFGYWIAQYALLQTLYSVAALMSVPMNPAELKLWRPMFGSIKKSYTMRNFWGKFWHQNIQLMVKGPAEFLTHRILRIPDRTLVARYSKIFFAFFVSGSMHVFADTGGVLTVAESGAMSFFCVQALGIMVEDAVQELYRRSFGDRGPLFRRVFGYIWVVIFLSWSTAIWVFPVVRTMKRDDMKLTISALYPLISSFFTHD